LSSSEVLIDPTIDNEDKELLSEDEDWGSWGDEAV
jgi:hypothetical protein